MATENPMRVVDTGGSGKWAPPRDVAFATSAMTKAMPDELGLLLRGGHNIGRDQSSIAPNRSGSAPPSMEGSFVTFGNNWRLPSIDSHGDGFVYVPRGSLSTHEEVSEDDESPQRASRARVNSRGIMPGQDATLYNAHHKSLVNLIQADFPRTPSPVFSQNPSSNPVEAPLHYEIRSLTLDSRPRKIFKQPELESGPGPSDTFLESIARDDPSQNQKQPLSPQKHQLNSNVEYFASPVDPDTSKNLHRVVDDYAKQDLALDGTVEMRAPHGTVETRAPHIEMRAPPPIYTGSAAYLAPPNSIYTNFSSTGVYPPYISAGASFIPQYLAGYSPHMGFPMLFNASLEQSFSTQDCGNSNRFYAQHGLTTHHPTFLDPFAMPYFQQIMQDPYSVPMQYSNHVGSFASRDTSYTPACSSDPKLQLSPSHCFGIPSPRRIGILSNSYSSLGFMPRFPTPPSPLGSLILQESPVRGAPSDLGFSQSSPENWTSYHRWKRQFGPDNINENRKHSFLEKLKTIGGRRIDLSDIVGHIVELSVDQHGSRFMQQKLETCSAEEKESVFREILPHCSKLVTNVFGNYVIQKFLENGTYKQRKELVNQLSGNMLNLTLQMYGCRVIQKALEVIEVEHRTELISELDGHVMRCVRDQNGNHVIQKCIECVPTEKLEFVISAFKGQVAALSTHPYACRVIQRIIEYCSNDPRCRSIVGEILGCVYDLAHDQYGNYVIQHVLQRGNPAERYQMIEEFSGNIVRMSHHKYASNVVEKCLESGNSAQRELLIEEILMQSDQNNDNLLGMMKDQFANYVVQKILDITNGVLRERLLGRIELHVVALRKYTYGKHIVARFEQLSSGRGDGEFCDA